MSTGPAPLGGAPSRSAVLWTMISLAATVVILYSLAPQIGSTAAPPQPSRTAIPSLSPPAVLPPAIERPPNKACSATPLLGVWRPSRLKVLGKCRSMTGVVVEVDHVPFDGDWKLRVDPDVGNDRFLAPGQQEMVIEVVPGQEFPIPSVGDHVGFFGTWVFDTNKDWNEFHPVWIVTYVESGKRFVSSPPADPEFHPEDDQGGEDEE